MKGLDKSNLILDDWFKLTGGKWRKVKPSTLKDWLLSDTKTGIVLQATVKKKVKK